MITLIITAALLALFTATFIYFLSACLQFFDFVIKGIKGIFKAIKVLILKKNGKVHYATMYQQDGKIKLVEPTNESEVEEDLDTLDESVKNAFAKAKVMKNGGKTVGVDMSEKEEEAIRNYK